MNIYTVSGDDNGLFLVVPHPDHEEYISIARIDKEAEEITLKTPYMAYIDGKNVRWGDIL